MQVVLGLALLRMPLLPAQVEPAKSTLVQTAGEISVLLQQSKYDVAFVKFASLLKEFPGTPFLHYAYGTALMALSQYDDAEKQMREEIKISPKSELPYLRLASMELKKRQPGEALPLAQRAVQLAASSAEGHYLLGRASLELGKNEDAIRELEMASQLEPGSPEVHFNLAKAYARARLTDKAEQERATFVRLNALAEQRRSQSGSQAYGAHNAADYSAPRPDAEKPAPPQRP
jgi:predicted Zn-dependent protease